MLPGLRLALSFPTVAPDAASIPDGSGLPDGVVYAGVASEGGPAAYSQVWEWGSTRQTKKGPKTTLGINPDGSRAWLTIQAPYGYVRTNAQRAAGVIERELSSVDPFASDARAQIAAAQMRAAEQIASLIRGSAPVDTGALMDSVKPVAPDDPDIRSVDRWSEGSFHEAFGGEAGE